LNLQGLNLAVYKGRHSAANPFEDAFSDRFVMRGAKSDYDLLGDSTDVSKAAAINGPGGQSGNKDKNEGSSTWMIIAIICLVILALGGLVYAYQAYNASGSLQNTDI